MQTFREYISETHLDIPTRKYARGETPETEADRLEFVKRSEKRFATQFKQRPNGTWEHTPHMKPITQKPMIPGKTTQAYTDEPFRDSKIFTPIEREEPKPSMLSRFGSALKSTGRGLGYVGLGLGAAMVGGAVARTLGFDPFRMFGMRNRTGRAAGRVPSNAAGSAMRGRYSTRPMTASRQRFSPIGRQR